MIKKAILFGIVLLLMPLGVAFAATTITIPEYDVDPVTGTPTRWEPQETEMIRFGGGYEAYGCKPRISVGWSNTIVADVYNMEGESLINGTNKTRVESFFAAGTWIGLRSKETIVANWQVYTSGEYAPKYYKLTKTKTCYYKKDGTPASSSASYVTITGNEYITEAKCKAAATASCNDKGGTIVGTTACTTYQTCVAQKPGREVLLDSICGAGLMPETRYQYSLSCKVTSTIAETAAKTAEQTITGLVGETLTCPRSMTKNGEYYYYTSESKETYNEPQEISVGETPREVREKCIEDGRAIAIEQAKDRVKEDVSGAKFINLNSYPANGIIKKSQLESITVPIQDKYNEEDYGTSGKITRVVLYRPNRVCLNQKTAAVEYKVKTNEKCPSGTLDVTLGKAKDGEIYWRYFIPLNTKSLQPFYFKIEKDPIQSLTEKQCMSVIRYYPLNYTKQIVLQNNNKFSENQVTALGQIGYNANGTDINPSAPTCKLQSGVTKLPGEVCKYYSSGLSGYTSLVRVPGVTLSINPDKALTQVEANNNSCQIKQTCTTSSPCYEGNRRKTSGYIWANANYNTCKRYITNNPMQNSYIKNIVFKSTSEGYTDEMTECTWKKTSPILDRPACKIYIENYAVYSDYPNLIRPKTKMAGSETEEYSYNKKKDEEQIDKDNGCYLSTIINFRVQQKFYGEVGEEGKKKLEGYNFYYRPINYSEPFPNGLASDSLWSGFYNEGDNTVSTKLVKNSKAIIKLDESFKNITYVADKINVSDIRKYTKKNPYTSWNDMNLNGTSNFISDYSITRKKNNIGTVYPLGCGPIASSMKTCYLDSNNKYVCEAICK